jgi:hypothetical protein
MAVKLYDASRKAQNMLPQRFERKFYLPPPEVGLAYGLLRHICLPASEYPSEQIHSLYFDTSDLDQYERSSSGDYQKDKVRIRWYCEDKDPPEMQTIFLELKSRRGFAGTKHRLKLRVPAEHLTLNRLSGGIVPGTLLVDTLAGFGYFPSGLLQPVIKISYWRYRFSDVMTGQHISLDHQIRSTMIIPCQGNGERELELLGGVLEIKGQTAELPASLRRARMLDMDWSRFSKYSACIDSHIERPGTVGHSSPSGRIVRL